MYTSHDCLKKVAAPGKVPFNLFSPSWHLQTATTHPLKYSMGMGLPVLGAAGIYSLLKNTANAGNQIHNGLRDVDEVVPPINKFGMDKSAGFWSGVGNAAKFGWKHKWPILGYGAGATALGAGYLGYKGLDTAGHAAGNFAGNAAYDLTHLGDSKVRGAGAFDNTMAYRALQDEMMKHTRMSQMHGMKLGMEKKAITTNPAPGAFTPWGTGFGYGKPHTQAKSINWQDHPDFSRNEMIKGINNKYTGAVGGMLGGSMLAKQMNLGSAGELLLTGLGGLTGYSQFPNVYNRMTNFPGMGSNSSSFSRSIGHGTTYTPIGEN